MKKKKVDTNEINYSYFYSLELENLYCFRDKQILDLSDSNGNYAQWTIILGDNGTGKTTLLKVLDRMQPFDEVFGSDEEDKIKLPIFTYDNYIKKRILPEKFKAKLSIFCKEEVFPLNMYINDDRVQAYRLLFSNIFLLSYGASRRMSKSTDLAFNEGKANKITSLFDESIELINAEEWFLKKDMISIKADDKSKKRYKNDFSLVKKILIDILPDVKDIRVKAINDINSNLLLEVRTSYGWVNMRNLSFGYQTLTALIVDIASKMMDRYPQSKNALKEPVILLIDEIDLHLHPKWQRVVVDKLSYYFPKAQFIVTAHSPLIVQAAQDRNANIVVCRKEDNKVIIDNTPESVKGWRIDQILTSDLFELSSSQSILFEEIRNEKTNILLKDKLTDSDKERLDFINNKLNNVPVFSSKEAITAEELLKKASDLLKK